MPKTKKQPIDGTARPSLPLESIPHFTEMAETAQGHADNVKKGPDYPTDKPVQDAVTKQEACVAKLKTTLSGLSDAHTTIALLEPQRMLDAAALHRSNDALETAIANSTAGVRAKIVAYGVKLAGHTPSVPSTDPPALVRGKSAPGSLSATFQCKADDRAICYHFAWGTDPSNPDAWTNTVVEGGAKHVAVGPFTHGQKIYFRIAIQRRKTGLGVWSGVVEMVIQ
jgi:hypothetical protein